MIRVTIPYRRQCFSPTVAAYMQELERALNDREAEIRAEAERALVQLLVYGRYPVKD